jgi:hypothetical protein
MEKTTNSHEILHSGFTCPGRGGLDCAKDPFANGVATFWSAPSDFPSVIPTSFPLTTTTLVGSVANFAALNRGVIVATGISTSSVNSTVSVSSAPQSTSNNSNTDSYGTGGVLTTGGKIALGVSIPLIIIIIVPLVFVFRRRRKARSTAAAVPEAEKKNSDLPAHFGRAELWAGKDAVPVEADSQEVKANVGLVGADGHPKERVQEVAHELPA